LNNKGNASVSISISAKDKAQTLRQQKKNKIEKTDTKEKPNEGK